MLKTIIRNLISNAMKFSFEGARSPYPSRLEGDFVTVSVKDTGKGIKKEDQDKLLKQDSHFTTYGTKNEKGSGLGLMLCKDFVELHGGKLWFESEGEGKGTTFLFSMKALNQRHSRSTYRLSLPIVDKVSYKQTKYFVYLHPGLISGIFVCRGDIRYIIIYRINIIIVCIP